MRIAVCDDEAVEIDTIKELICRLENDEKHITCFRRGEELILSMEKNKYDLVFLDIYMEGISGIETAHAIKERYPDTEIVFTTISKDFAVEAFNIEALHYIIKPVSMAQMRMVLERYHKKRKEVIYLKVQSGRDNINLRMDKICYLQSRNNGTDIFFWNDMLHINMNTSSLAKQLNYLFLNIRRGMYVNMNYIKLMKSDYCILENGDEVLLSRKERTKIRSRYKEFMYCSVVKER